jgi:syntaxin 16
MASKNLTRTYIDIRNSCKANRHLQTIGGGGSDDDSVSLLGPANREVVRWKETMESNLPPMWVDIVEEVEDKIDTIRKKMRVLSHMHAKRLMVDFETDEKEQEHEVDDTTREITSMFRRAEALLKRFGTQGDETKISASEKVVRNNMQRSIAKKLQGLSGAFRQNQKDYLGRIKAQKSGCISKELDFLHLPVGKGTSDYDLDRGDFNQAQLQELKENEEMVNQRDQEILKITQSIEELAQIFKELAVLVIDQGTVLDRIDYNMEQVVEHTREGISQLLVAEESQKSATGIKCIVILVLLICLCILILYYKWTARRG